MVTGVDRFRAHFADHEHQHVLIGGAACELIVCRQHQWHRFEVVI